MATVGLSWYLGLTLAPDTQLRSRPPPLAVLAAVAATSSRALERALPPPSAAPRAPGRSRA